MKKKLFSIFLLIVLSLSFIYVAIGCVDRTLRKAKNARYVEYTEMNGKMYFRWLKAGGYGYIVLGGEKVPANFSFGMRSTLVITISAKYAPEGHKNAYSTDEIIADDVFDVYDLNENDQIKSQDEEVELFGEKFERIVLTLNRLDADDFDAWEYSDYWKSDTSDDYAVVNFAQYYLRQGADKCAEISVKKSADANKEYYIFKWLPEEKGFEIYLREDDEQYVPQEGQEPISTGTYKKEGEKFNETVTLTFITDGLFDGKYPTLELVRKY